MSSRLPNETWVRFALLVLAAFASALSIAHGLSYALFLDAANAIAQECAAQFSTDLAGRQVCELPQARLQLRWTVLIALVTLLSAGAAAAVASFLRRRPLTYLPDAPPVRNVLSAAVRLSRMDDRVPELLWQRRRPISMARADGFVRPYVEVGLNWVGLAAREPAVARAVLLHELHHLRSRDVLPSQISLWVAPAVTTLGLVYLVQLLISTPESSLGGVFRLAAAVGVVLLGRASVLRAREFDADAAAALYEPVSVRAFLALPTVDRGPRLLARGPFALHPSAPARATVLDKPGLLGHLGPADGIIVGLSTAMGGQILTELWRAWTPPGEVDFWAELAGWGITGALFGVWIATMLLRAVVAERAGGQPPRLGVFCALTAASMLLGLTMFRSGFGLGIDWLPATAIAVAGMLMLSLGLTATVHWLHTGIGWWLDLAPARRRAVALTGTMLVGAAVGGLALGVLASAAVRLEKFGAFTGASLASTMMPVLLYQTTSLPMLALLLLLVGGPLVLTLLPVRTGGRLPEWAATDGNESGANGRVRMRGSAAAGVIAGLLAIGADLVQRTLVEPRPGADWYETSSRLYTVLGSVIGVLVVGGVVAAGLAKNAEVQRACLAGFVAASVAAPGLALIRGDVWLFIPLLRDLASIGVLAALLITGIMLSLPKPRTLHPAVRAAATAGATVAIIALALAQMNYSRPTPTQDFAWFSQHLVAADAESALRDCLALRTGDPHGISARSSLNRLETGQRPATAQVGSQRAEVIAALSECANAQKDALAQGSTSLTPDMIPTLQSRMNMLADMWKQVPDAP